MSKKLTYLGFAAAVTLLASCSSTSSVSSSYQDAEPIRKAYVQNAIVGDSPIVAELEVDPVKVSATYSSYAKSQNMDDAKNRAMFEACKKNNASLLVEPRYSIEYLDGKISTVTVTGYPAKYKNIHEYTENDSYVLRLLDDTNYYTNVYRTTMVNDDERVNGKVYFPKSGRLVLQVPITGSLEFDNVVYSASCSTNSVYDNPTNGKISDADKDNAINTLLNKTLADFVIDPTFVVSTDGATITVQGYTAKYKDFRSLTANDLGASPLQTEKKKVKTKIVHDTVYIENQPEVVCNRHPKREDEKKINLNLNMNINAVTTANEDGAPECCEVKEGDVKAEIAVDNKSDKKAAKKAKKENKKKNKPAKGEE